MPAIVLITTAAIPPAVEAMLTKGLGHAIELLPGKSESHLMISYQEKTPMAFHGEKQSACAFLEVSCFGRVDPKGYDAMTGAVCKLLEDTLQIPAASTYIKYTETTNWGWNKKNF
ncbi:MAG: hypothetical protein LBC83_05845 [Oscillospiraceae bacterium]|jgi:hypothetical protein|nr:hypothetical protein [Oscillospiraceae bacterium]